MLKKILGEIIRDELIGKESIQDDCPGFYIGKRVVVRTYSAGVHFGTLIFHKEKEVILKDSRRVFYWTHACSLSQLAIEGSKQIDQCQIAVALPEIYLSEAIEIIPMSDVADKQLSGAKEWKK